MTKKIRTTDFNLREIEEDLKPQFDIFTEEDNDIYRLKHIIFNTLDEVDRRIILLYTDVGSQRDVAKKLGVSLATANKILREIQNKILNEYYSKSDADNADNCVYC